MTEIYLTVDQERRRKQLQRTLKKALNALMDLGREVGVSNPTLYYESEGSLYVMDGDVLRKEQQRSLGDAQGAVRIIIPLHIFGMDCGAW